MKIIVGSDQAGSGLLQVLTAHLATLGHEVVEVSPDPAGAQTDYPDVAVALAQRVARGEFARGVLVCGTGIGMAMVANKVPGVRAACCHDPYSAERSRRSNDAQVITMGAEIVGPALARALLERWLAADFSGGRSTRKVSKIRQLDHRTAAALGETRQD